MILAALVTEVQQQTGVSRDLIARRAREAWPQTVDFKDVQLRLMVDQMRRDTMQTARVTMLGAVSKPRRVVRA